MVKLGNDWDEILSSWIGIFGTTKCSDTAIVTKYI